MAYSAVAVARFARKGTWTVVNMVGRTVTDSTTRSTATVDWQWTGTVGIKQTPGAVYSTQIRVAGKEVVYSRVAS